MFSSYSMQFSEIFHRFGFPSLLRNHSEPEQLEDDTQVCAAQSEGLRTREEFAGGAHHRRGARSLRAVPPPGRGPVQPGAGRHEMRVQHHLLAGIWEKVEPAENENRLRAQNLNTAPTFIKFEVGWAFFKPVVCIF